MNDIVSDDISTFTKIQSKIGLGFIKDHPCIVHAGADPVGEEGGGRMKWEPDNYIPMHLHFYPLYKIVWEIVCQPPTMP